MAKWIEGPCREILKKLNEVPFDDDREQRQLSLLMSGISEVTREMMRRAAESTRASLADVTDTKAGSTGKPASEEAATTNKALEDVPDLDDFDSFDEELDLIEQTLIRSIGD